MSIRIADSGSSAVRREVVQRLGRLIGAAYALAQSEVEAEGMVSDTHQRLLDEVRSLFAALLGSHPTPEEMSQVGAQ